MRSTISRGSRRSTGGGARRRRASGRRGARSVGSRLGRDVGARRGAALRAGGVGTTAGWRRSPRGWRARTSGRASRFHAIPAREPHRAACRPSSRPAPCRRRHAAALRALRTDRHGSAGASRDPRWGRQFGLAGDRLQAIAGPRPTPDHPGGARARGAPTFGTPWTTFLEPCTLRRLAAELCERLRDRNLAPGRAVLLLDLEDAPALRVAQPFPQPALEPDWIARLLLSRLEAAARAQFLRNSRVATVTQESRPQAGDVPVENMGKSMSDGTGGRMRPIEAA